MAYGGRRDYKPIEIFTRYTGTYLCTTTWANNLKVAREKAAEALGVPAEKLAARYAKVGQ